MLDGKHVIESLVDLKEKSPELGADQRRARHGAAG
jgi:hypothetical protein